MSITFEPSEQSETEYFNGLLTRFDEALKRQQELNKLFPYIQQSELLKKLSISTSYLDKLLAHGLKRVILEEGDRTIWYSLPQLTQLMDELAE